MRRAQRHRFTSWVALAVGVHLAFGSVAWAAPPRRPAPKAAAPKEPDLIAKGQQLFEDQEYEDSIQTLSAALVRPNNTREQKVEIYRLLALNYITLGRKAEADNAVRGLLVVYPDYELPETESPRFRDFFRAARLRWEAEGRPGLAQALAGEHPITIRHASPSSAEAGRPIALRATLDDPNKRVGRVKLYYRAGSKGEFAVATTEIQDEAVRAQIPAAAVKPPLVDYYFEAVDPKGAYLTSRGDAQAPLRIAVPDREEEGSSWVLPVAIGGGILGAAAIVGGLALAGVFKGASTPPGGRNGNSTVTVNVGEAGLRF